jgi:ATP-dependent Clp protease ATP-binding subunit ClpB
MTSNLGSDIMFEHQGEREKMETEVMAVVRRHFRPEFLNRIDDIVLFDPLGEAMLKDIVKLQVHQLVKLVAEEKRITLHIDEKVYDHLLKKGYDPAYGARPLRRAIQTELMDELAMAIIEGKVAEGDAVRASVVKDAIVIKKET